MVVYCNAYLMIRWLATNEYFRALVLARDINYLILLEVKSQAHLHSFVRFEITVLEIISICYGESG